MVCSFLTNDKIYKYISNMCINLTPYSIAIGEENTQFLTPDFKFVERENIKNINSIEKNEDFVDLFDYHDLKCRKGSFKKIGVYKIFSNYDK